MSNFGMPPVFVYVILFIGFRTGKENAKNSALYKLNVCINGRRPIATLLDSLIT